MCGGGRLESKQRHSHSSTLDVLLFVSVGGVELRSCLLSFFPHFLGFMLRLKKMYINPDNLASGMAVIYVVVEPGEPGFT